MYSLTSFSEGGRALSLIFRTVERLLAMGDMTTMMGKGLLGRNQGQDN